MPMGTRHRIDGILRRQRTHYVLDVDGGGYWIVDFGVRPVWRHVGQRITVEGTRSGFNLLDVDRLFVDGRERTILGDIFSGIARRFRQRRD